MAKYRIGIIGYGKIAQDQHAPAILADSDFELLAVSESSRRLLSELRQTWTTLNTRPSGGLHAYAGRLIPKRRISR